MDTYVLGVDLGTTNTAAAISRNGRAEIVDLGSRSSVAPSALFLGEDGQVLVGDAALRRGAAEPDRLVREFKRRFGDPVPLIVGGSPISADALTAKLLSWVLDSVTERQGGPPAAVAVTYPANWGPYKRELLDEALRSVGLEHALLISEPEAAAVSYASAERLEPGEAVAVYDLGGGTFDAAVVRRTESGFELLGRPEGIERLGGVDFDAAVLTHVRGAVGAPLVDPGDDRAGTAALQRLCDDCAEAKEALSDDTAVAIPVSVPGVHTNVRLTRAEFESMIGPSLAPTLDVLERVVASADLRPADLRAVLLVGGSSRIPLVSVLVAQRMGRPVAVDAHPKNAVALGAAEAVGASLSADAVPAPATGPISIVRPAAVRQGRPATPARPALAPVLAAPLAGMRTKGAGRHRRQRMALVTAIGVVAVLVAAGVLFAPRLFRNFDTASAATGTTPVSAVSPEVVPEPATQPGTDPYTGDAAGGDRQGVNSEHPSGSHLPGDQAGLYGGTLNERVCDKGKLTEFLAAHADKAAAWAAALGISPDEVSEYLNGLTPVLLRFDTKVINNGFRDGHATPRQAVLQAGTAVLIDPLGRPRVKCGCGNPLVDPLSADSADPVSPWVGFSRDSVVTVQPAADPAGGFTLIDVDTGKQFVRPRGTSGEADTSADLSASTSAAASASASASASAGSSSTATSEGTPKQVTLTVPAGSGWVDSGIRLAPGAKISISASGSWTDGARSSVGPDGYPARSPDNFLNLTDLGSCATCAKTATAEYGALIGYLGGSPPRPGSYTSTSVESAARTVFLVGGRFDPASAPGSGELWLAQNADAYSGNTTDNSGQITVTITIS